MLMGQMIDQLADDDFAAEALIGLGDLALLVEVDAIARTFDETPALYASGAARRFSQLAGDDDWLALMTALKRSDDPASACLKQMLVWSLSRDKAGESCGCGASCKEERGHV